jgi:hypothetical protein
MTLRGPELGPFRILLAVVLGQFAVFCFERDRSGALPGT